MIYAHLENSAGLSTAIVSTKFPSLLFTGLHYPTKVQQLHFLFQVCLRQVMSRYTKVKQWSYGKRIMVSTIHHVYELFT